jgi:hypothetical protein
MNMRNSSKRNKMDLITHRNKKPTTTTTTRRKFGGSSRIKPFPRMIENWQLGFLLSKLGFLNFQNTFYQASGRMAGQAIIFLIGIGQVSLRCWVSFVGGFELLCCNNRGNHCC